MSTSQVQPNIFSSVIDLKSLDSTEIYSLFDFSLKLKLNDEDIQSQLLQLGSGSHNINKSSIRKTAALLFFEPSTRTRFSFESACVRAGVHPLILDGSVGTSLEKGETIEDTILNIEAMMPLFFVIRAPDNLNLIELATKMKTPVLSAGWGRLGHPTQALLDALTIFEKYREVKNKKILFVGDIKHSRVVSSHLELAEILNYDIGFCAPDEMLPESLSFKSKVQYFTKLQDGLPWADVVIALRVQKERHTGLSFDMSKYISEFNLNSENIKKIKKEGLILHPGPINYGVELNQDILLDSRVVIMEQVRNGVFIREAIIHRILGRQNK
ncbi:MAG: aspartate carbamoyltransferase catalytic subunit [Pseudobdellovibrio sp.]